jgi:hypothetical protein
VKGIVLLIFQTSSSKCQSLKLARKSFERVGNKKAIKGIKERLQEVNAREEENHKGTKHKVLVSICFTQLR